MSRDIAREYTEYIKDMLVRLMSIDSPSGYTKQVTQFLMDELSAMGYKPYKNNKGCVIVEIGGSEEPVIIASHVDTLGGMVKDITGSGTLKITPIGGLVANNIETENCRVITYDDRIYGANAQLGNASVHVNNNLSTAERNFDSIEIILDEIVKNKEDVKKLGIETGNYVCFDTRTVIADSGIIKSRFLDDKYSTAILMGLAKAVKEEKVCLGRKVYLFFSVYEEVGHGAKSGIPTDAVEILSVDMGCVGNGLECNELMVSICCKDSAGPYDYEVTRKLVECAKKAELDYATDVYPYYGSDADAALNAGYDLKHGLIGPGVYASHGYERSSIQAGENTLALLIEYLK